MIKTYTLFSMLSFLTLPLYLLSASSARAYKPFFKHKSAEFTHNALTARSLLTRSTPSSENDQDLACAISMNTCIGEAILKLSNCESMYATSSSSVLAIPRLHILNKPPKAQKLLKQAFRTLGILGIVAEKYPEDSVVRAQITIIERHILTLDPPTNPDGIPESVRDSSERKRRWEKLCQSARISFQQSFCSKTITFNDGESDTKTPLRKKDKARKAKRSKKRKPIRREHKSLMFQKRLYEVKKVHANNQSIDKDALIARLNEMLATPSSTTEISYFMETLYILVGKIDQRITQLHANKLNFDTYESTYQDIITQILPLFTPLIEHYYSGLPEDKVDKIEDALFKAYKAITHIQSAGVFVIMSEQTARNFDTCAMIIQGIQTPRSKQKEEQELYTLYNNFTENMSLIQKQQKTAIRYEDEPYIFRDSRAWQHATEISEKVLITTAIELLRKLKRCDDLLKLNVILSRNPLFQHNHEIKDLMENATKKIAHEALKERGQISSRKSKSSSST